MNREKIGLDARLCQLGQKKRARRLAAFERLLQLLRRGLAVGWVWNLPLFRRSGGWVLLACGSALVYALSLLLSACERLLKNRWMEALRGRRAASVTEQLGAFSRRDVLLAVRIAVFYHARWLGRSLLLCAFPALLTAVGVRLAAGGVSKPVFYGGAVGLAVLWGAALFFLLAAWEPLQTAASLLIDPNSFAQRKSSLAQLDKNCFRLAKFSFSWLMLSGGARFQARALFASIRQ